MPSGLDQMFWMTQGPIFPHVNGLVAKAAFELPEIRTRFLEKLRHLSSDVFDVQSITNQVDQLARRLQPILSGLNSDAGDGYLNRAGEFSKKIAERFEHVRTQLANPPKLLNFDPAGAARLTEWTSRAEFGRPRFERMTSPDGGDVLQIIASGTGIGLWSSKVWLEQGRYRLEGKVKVEGVAAAPGDPRGGAGFRVGRRYSKRVKGDSDWAALTHDLQVDMPMSEVELFCELRGAAGSASFDLGTLRLIRR
jgi:hypothetical protein